MNEWHALALAWIAGAGLGAIFFGGLWWTIRAGAASRRPALWFSVSALVRMCIALAGFYFVSGAHWERLLSCLLGFVMARVAAMLLTRPAADRRDRRAREAAHAP